VLRRSLLAVCAGQTAIIGEEAVPCSLPPTADPSARGPAWNPHTLPGGSTPPRPSLSSHRQTRCAGCPLHHTHATKKKTYSNPTVFSVGRRGHNNREAATVIYISIAKATKGVGNNMFAFVRDGNMTFCGGLEKRKKRKRSNINTSSNAA